MAAGGAFLFSCRLLAANLTKNNTPQQVFFIHFAFETYCPGFKLTRSIAQYGFRN